MVVRERDFEELFFGLGLDERYIYNLFDFFLKTLISKLIYTIAMKT